MSDMNVNFEFVRKTTMFGCLKDDYVIALINDPKPSVLDQKNLISLLDCEIVKVHVEKKFTMLAELQRVEPSSNPVDEKVINRKNAFKGIKPEQLNKPFKAKFSPHIVTEWQETIRTTIFCNSAGSYMEIPGNIPSDEQATIAKLLKANFVLAEFQVENKLSGEVSAHRSQAKI